jgi:glycosyltransferase involved in cell wall biosynthesis
MITRVLHVSHSAGLSGAEQALLRVVRPMDRTRFESLVVLPAEGPLCPALTAAGGQTCVLPIRWWIPATNWNADYFASQFEGLETRWQDLAELAVREKIDLIHSNTLVTIEGALAAMALGIPHVWHSRGSFGHGFPPVYADNLAFYFSVVDDIGGHVACVSKSVLEQTRQYVRRTPCSVIADGLDLDDLVCAQGADLKELDLAGDATLIACIGGIQRRKGQLDLVNAMPLIRREHPGVVLLLCGAIGDAPYGAEVQDRIDELGLRSSVRILGFRSDVASIISRCQIVVHPSYSEGFPLAVLESMAAGKPVVATHCGGTEDMIEDGISGVLVRLAAQEELAQAVCKLLTDPDRAQAIGKAARERAQLFSASACASRLQDLFAAVLSASPSTRCPDPARATAVSSRVITAAREAANGRLDLNQTTVEEPKSKLAWWRKWRR